MKIYGTVITCPKCNSEDIKSIENKSSLTSERNKRDFWALFCYKCTCKTCGYSFKEAFSLQRKTEP